MSLVCSACLRNLACCSQQMLYPTLGSTLPVRSVRKSPEKCWFAFLKSLRLYLKNRKLGIQADRQNSPITISHRLLLYRGRCMAEFIDQFRQTVISCIPRG